MDMAPVTEFIRGGVFNANLAKKDKQNSQYEGKNKNKSFQKIPYFRK
jgi:hypothetical protein